MSVAKEIRCAAINLLARREHTESELLRKLKNYPRDEVKEVIAELSAENLISHTRFIENFIHARKRKGYGPLRIQMELQERGLKEDFIEEHLNIADNAWLAEARAVFQKKFKNKKDKKTQDAKTRAQQMRFLQYRGFTHEQIKSIYDDE